MNTGEAAERGSFFKRINGVIDGARADGIAADRKPIHRNSRRRGSCEGSFWRGTSRQDVQKVLMAARYYDRAKKEPGKRNGPLGGIALEVLALFANLVNFKSGRLDPSLDYITDKLCRSRDAVVRALKSLRDHGFLDWLRRFEPVPNEAAGRRCGRSAMLIACLHRSAPLRFSGGGLAGQLRQMMTKRHAKTAPRWKQSMSKLSTLVAWQLLRSRTQILRRLWQ